MANLCQCGNPLIKTDLGLTCDEFGCVLNWQHVDIGWRVHGYNGKRIGFVGKTYWTSEHGSFRANELCMKEMERNPFIIGRGIAHLSFRMARQWRAK